MTRVYADGSIELEAPDRLLGYPTVVCLGILATQPSFAHRRVPALPRRNCAV